MDADDSDADEQAWWCGGEADVAVGPQRYGYDGFDGYDERERSKIGYSQLRCFAPC